MRELSGQIGTSPCLLIRPENTMNPVISGLTWNPARPIMARFERHTGFCRYDVCTAYLPAQ